MAAFSVASRRSNSSDIILRASSEPPPPSVAPVARTRFKTLIYLKAFGARVRRQGRGCARSYSDHPRPADDVRAHVAAEQSAIPRGKRQDLASEGRTTPAAPTALSPCAASSFVSRLRRLKQNRADRGRPARL